VCDEAVDRWDGGAVEGICVDSLARAWLVFSLAGGWTGLGGFHAGLFVLLFEACDEGGGVDPWAAGKEEPVGRTTGEGLPQLGPKNFADWSVVLPGEGGGGWTCLLH